MKKLLMTIIFLMSLQAVFGQQDFPMPMAADYPKVPETGARPADFIPPKWKIIGEDEGDLNGDKISDTVLAIQGTDAKFISKNTGLGTDPFDTNPRMLVILFNTGNGFKLAEKSNSMIAMPDSPTMETPFDSVEIKNGVLHIKQHIFMNAGGWGTSNYTYKFRYQNGEFALIGADRMELQRNTGETTDSGYNFLTRKVEIKKGNIENNRTKRTLRVFKVGKLQTIKTFPKPFEWEVEKDSYL